MVDLVYSRDGMNGTSEVNVHQCQAFSRWRYSIFNLDIFPALQAKLQYASSTFQAPVILSQYRTPPPSPKVPPSWISHHGQRSHLSLQMGDPNRRRRCLRPSLHVRCQRRHTSGDLRPSIRSQGDRRQRRHPFPDPLAAEIHHLRRPHQTQEHLDYHRQQGFADGQLDVEGAA